MIVLFAVVTGGLGAVSRFVVDGEIKSRLGDRVPWGTLIINVTGSLLLGILTGLVIHDGAPDSLRVIAGTGFCGGYTTFSTATFETVRIVQRGAVSAAGLYSVGTVALTAIFAALGLVVTA